MAAYCWLIDSRSVVRLASLVQNQSALLRQAISYIDDALPSAVEHSDWDGPDLCYLTAGDTEKALLSIETQLSHNHLYAWNVSALLPIYDPIRHEPRYQAVWAEYERRIAVQREAIDLKREAGE